MKKRNLLSLFVSIALLITVFTACSNDNNNAPTDDKVTLTMWHTFSDVETEVFESKVIAKFNENYPNITIDATRMPSGDEFNQQLVQAVSGSSAPDLARMDIVDVPRYAKLGALEPLDEYEGFEGIKSEMFEGPMSSNFYDGKYYGIPLDTNTKIAIYNKKLLEKAGLTEAPKTFDELVEAAKKISNDETFGFAPQNIEVWGTMPYFFTLGGTYTNEDYTKATGYLNSDTSVKALEQLVAWNKEGLIGKSFEGGLGSWEGFKGDNYMMIDDGPWFAAANQDVADNIEFAVFPAGPAGSIETNGGENTVIFNSSKHKEAAYTFAKFLASDDAQTIFGEELRMMPVNTKTAEKDFVKNDEMLNLYMEQLKTAISRVPSPEWTVINNVVTKAFEAAIKTDQKPKDLLDDAAKQVDALLAK